MENNIEINSTIAAIATPLAVGGISIIRISGINAIEVADRVFRANSGVLLRDKKGYTASYGAVFSAETESEKLDTSVAVLYRAPKSYTGEDVVELSCHGGIYITREVLRAVLDCGAKLAAAGEFTKRAYMNGKMNLTQAEAVIDVINSHNKQAMNAAKTQLDGALYKKIKSVKDELLNIAGHLAAWVDYPEEDIPVIEHNNLVDSLEKAKQAMEKLLNGYDTGKLFKEGIDTAIIGKPNVGKSTLMNLLVGEQRSIVTEIAGTTRDVIEETVMLGDIMLKLSDTAGIRETTDSVEKFGVEIAKKRMERATLVLAVFDSSSKISNEDKQIIENIGDKLAIAIINKSDLDQKIHMDYIDRSFKNVVYISAKTADGIEQLTEIIERELKLYDVDTSAAMLVNERQRECAIGAKQYIDESLSAINSGVTLDAVTISIEQAIDALMELTGERITVELVNQVFSHFCVGK